MFQGSVADRIVASPFLHLPELAPDVSTEALSTLPISAPLTLLNVLPLYLPAMVNRQVTGGMPKLLLNSMRPALSIHCIWNSLSVSEKLLAPAVPASESKIIAAMATTHDSVHLIARAPILG